MSCFFSVLQGLLTPLIAIIVACISYQQWRTNQRKLKLDLYDRRFRVYEAAKEVILDFPIDYDSKLLKKLYEGSVSADFLFGKEIPEYLATLYEKGFKLKNLNDLRSENLTKEAMEEIMSIQKWFGNQYVEVRDKFYKYLDFSELI